MAEAEADKHAAPIWIIIVIQYASMASITSGSDDDCVHCVPFAKWAMLFSQNFTIIVTRYCAPPRSRRTWNHCQVPQPKAQFATECYIFIIW